MHLDRRERACFIFVDTAAKRRNVPTSTYVLVASYKLGTLQTAARNSNFVI